MKFLKIENSILNIIEDSNDLERTLDKEKEFFSKEILFQESKNKLDDNFIESVYSEILISKEKLDIFLSDERCLKFGNKNLNANIFKNKFNNSLVKFHPIIKKKTSFLSAAKVYNKVLPKNPAIILLSVGDDGHIASIFNKSKAIKSNKNVLFMKKKYKKYQRITATLKYLKNKKNIFLLCKGRKRLRIFEN